MKMKMKTRIFLVLLLTLLLMLGSSLIVFNTFGETYIRDQARQDLADASALLEEMIAEQLNFSYAPDTDVLTEPLKLIRSLMRNRFLFSDDNVFMMNDSGFVFTMSDDNSQELMLAQLLLQNRDLFELRDIISVDYEDNSFYMLLKRLGTGSEHSWYAVIYVDTSLLYQLLANQKHLLLMSLAAAMFFVALLAYLLIAWLTKPIDSMKNFARRIGSGDFTPDETHIDDSDLAELHDEMNAMAARIAADQEEQKRFFQNISHDLRTPLMSIQGYAEGIQYGVFEDVQKPASVILEESRRMYGMIDNLVYLSYMESVDIKPEQLMDIREQLSRSIEKMQGVALHDGKELICSFADEALPVMLDETSLAHAWQNLLSNALRYCRSSVHIECLREGEQALIRITDDGSGFAEEDMPQLFRRFYKGRGGNYGLGLSIAKEAIEKHHGSISARNSEEGGAQFDILLPLCRD